MHRRSAFLVALALILASVGCFGGVDTVRAVHVEPFRGPYRTGTHTLSSAGARTIVDGYRFTASPGGLWHFARSSVRAALVALGMSESDIARLRGKGR